MDISGKNTVSSVREAQQAAINVIAEQKKHSSHLWKTQNDAVMVPDRGFTKQLKMLGDTLEVVWDNGSHVWEIWDMRTDIDPYMVTRVQTKGKSYRELGTDVLLAVERSIFFMNNLTPKQICDYLDEADEQVRRRREQDFRNKIRSIARDTFLWCQGVLQVQVPRSLKIERSVKDAKS